ncbi:hypothetical protein [Emticicia agri]|uniref:Uncharacterized protein n=1 Tax=Emticicia agri TaxID=2492393 RepID=A0A4Q5LXI7_9BACT|nr:hypothetical protein [Emticicia agri]RYU94267.1 hypothetical protein EWM59_17770 [Emticicia agri]
MKALLIISIVNFVIACGGTDKPSYVQNKDTLAIARKDTVKIIDSLRSGLSEKENTITVSYAAIACGCPQWFETKFKDIAFLEGVGKFYVEPISKDLIDANTIWDGEHLPLTIKVTGRFSKEKGIPRNRFTKEIPEEAQVFWYDKIKVISPE